MKKIVLQQCCYGSMEGIGYNFKCSDPSLVGSEMAKKDIRLLFDTPNDKEMQSCFSYLTASFGQKESYACFFQAGWNREEKRLMQYGQMYMTEAAQMEYGEPFLQMLRVQFDRGEDIIKPAGRTEKSLGELKLAVWDTEYYVSPEDLQQILAALYEKKQVAYVLEDAEEESLSRARYLIWEVYRRLPCWYRKNLGCTAGTTLTFMMKEDFPAYKLIVLWNEDNGEGLKSWEAGAADRCVIRQGQCCLTDKSLTGDRDSWLGEISHCRERLPEDFLSEEFEKCREYIEKNLRPAEMPSIDLYIEFLRKFNSWKTGEPTDERLDQWLEDYKDPKLQKPLLSTLKQYYKIGPDVIAGWLQRKGVCQYLLEKTEKEEALPRWIRYFGLYEQLLGEDGKESCKEKIYEWVLEQSDLGRSQMTELSGGIALLESQERQLEGVESHLNTVSTGRGGKGWWAQLLQKLLLTGQKNKEELRRQIAAWTAKEAERIMEPLAQSSLPELKDVINRCMEEGRSIPGEPGEITVNNIKKRAVQCFVTCQEEYEVSSLEALQSTIKKAEELINCFPWLDNSLSGKWKNYQKLLGDRVFDPKGYTEEDVLNYLNSCRRYGSAGDDMRRLFLLRDDPLWNREDRTKVRQSVREERFGKLEKVLLYQELDFELINQLKWLRNCLAGTGLIGLIMLAALLVQLWIM